MINFSLQHFRWRIFRRPIIGHPEKVVAYLEAAIALHNYLRTTESTTYCLPGFVDGEDGVGNQINGIWRNDEDACTGLASLHQAGGNR